MFQAVRDHGLVLNPHNTEPMPRDGRKPNEQDILIAGAYNLGFIGIGSGDVRRPAARLVGRAARARLHRRSRARLLRRPALDRPRAGDGGRLPRAARPRLQRRLLEPAHAHGRASATARWFVNGDVPLRLFHFSGFDASKPAHALQAPGPHPADRRAARWRSCAASTPTSSIGERRRRGLAAGPTPTTRRASGLAARPAQAPALPRPDRRRLRRVAASSPRARRRSPHAATAPAASAAAQYGITRYLAALLRRARRPAAQRYPDLGNPADGRGLRRVGAARSGATRCRSRRRCCRRARAVHAADNGRRSRRGPPPASSRRDAAAVARRQRRRLPRTPSSASARSRARSSTRSTPPACRRCRSGSSPPRSRQGHGFAHVGASPDDYPINLVCVNADMLPALRRAASARRSSSTATRSGCGGGRRRSSPSAGTARSSYVDELWAGSAVRRRRARRGARRCRSCTMPMPVTLPPVTARPRAALGLPGGLRVPVRLRLQLGVRAQEPARAARGVPARVPRPGGGRAARPQEHQRRAAPERARPAAARGGRATRTCTCSTATSHPTEKNGDDRGCRLLRVAAPLRGLRDHDGRGDAARQAGRRHRVLRQPRLHAARERATSSTTSWRRSARAATPTRPRRSGPSRTSTTRRS